MDLFSRGQANGPRVVIADADEASRAWVVTALERSCHLEVVTRSADALEALENEPELVIVGPALEDMSGRELLEAIRRSAHPPRREPLAIGDWPEEGEVYYAVHTGMPGEDLRSLVQALIDAPRHEHEADGIDLGKDVLRSLLDVSRTVARQRDLRGAARVMAVAARNLIGADRAECLFYDAESGSLWSPVDDDFDALASASLVGFAVRVRRQVCITRLDASAHHRPEIDERWAEASDRVLIQPIASSDAQVHAVVIASRGERKATFDASSKAVARAFAEYLGPVLEALGLQLETEARLDAGGDEEETLFRRDALNRLERRRGDLVHLSPKWLSRAYWLLVAFGLGAASYLILAAVSQYSTGHAVIRVTGRTELTARVQGTIVATAVAPGQSVEIGDVILQMDDTHQRSELERIEQEFEFNLVSMLRDPGNEAARRRLAELRAERERALVDLDARIIRAPLAGNLTDIRVRPGQLLRPGDTVASIVRSDSERHVVAFLPGDDRPQFEQGQILRLQITGYRYAYQEVVVDEIGEEVIGPLEVHRFLGDQLANSVELDGPLVMVKARLPSDRFESDGQTYRYYDGMQGIAKLKLRRERIIFALLPALKRKLETMREDFGRDD